MKDNVSITQRLEFRDLQREIPEGMSTPQIWDSAAKQQFP